MTDTSDLLALVASVVDKYDDELVGFRRDLHRHPELSWQEHRTVDRVAERLDGTGWKLTRTPRSGLVADLGETGPRVALRADLDALPVADLTTDGWRSENEGVAHACGHDVHTTSLVGAALALAELHHQGLLGGRVRLLFQPAEEVMPGGAKHLISHGALEGVDRIFALHCDPSVDVGAVGVRSGPITSAADRIDVRLEGNGGHTSRPHLTGDLTFALAKVASELPAVLSRRMDPRAGVSVVWGMLRAGLAANVIPDSGIASGTVRILEAQAWASCEPVVREAVLDIVRPYGVIATVDYLQGVPPVVNDALCTAMVSAAADELLGPHHRTEVEQSLGGEDFGWYLEEVPGAMFRLGTRTPGGPRFDLHQGDFEVDEQAPGFGARMLAGVAVLAIAAGR
ncbi:MULTISPECIES: amidohydrolase [unclassified Nocardioides]|uniref:amidohydrolase n=1 Tax=unclassified Nocardioides TaxID=2615069 RepID=UPI0007035149|nr:MULTISPECIES: amidohydrolase [unclassified Nocardioides]KRC46517.1 N-acyl-L-amino acid amidohydrolase [Nocardioides sp. Root79]KRC69860.1 N-acyl-L-amino acid amidohydrolase [Nocardioides sp. Root240]